MNRARPGLSLVEVLVAVLMLGISVTTLLALQGVLSRGVFSVHAAIDRLPFILNYFVEVDREKLFKQNAPQTKKIEFPSINLTYNITDAPSPLTAQVKLEKIEAHWSTAFGTNTEAFARLRFVPSVEKA